MFIFHDSSVTPNSIAADEDLTLEMEKYHPGIVIALQNYIADNPSLIDPDKSIWHVTFNFDDIDIDCDLVYYNTQDLQVNHRRLWQYLETDEPVWFTYDPNCQSGEILANVPMQVEAIALGHTYGYRATWTGHNWVFDDFDPEGGAPDVQRFRLWDR